MKFKILPRPLLVCVFAAVQTSSLSADPSYAYPDGLFLDPDGNAYLEPWTPNTGRRSVTLETWTGGLFLHSGIDETSPGSKDGGINIQGSPVSVILSTNSSIYPDEADFNVWQGSKWGTGQPLLNIDGLTGNTTFKLSDVAINDGSLKVNGSPVITSASASSVLTAGGFVNTTNFNSTLSAATPPTSSAWTAAFVPRGNVTPVGLEGGLLALGTSTASGEKSFAVGSGSVASAMATIAMGTGNTASVNFATAIGQNSTASGQWGVAIGNGVSATAPYAVAQGQNSTASMNYAFARGSVSVASGLASNALGAGASAKANAETALGSYNLESVVTNGVVSNGLYGLLRVGNGTSTTRSDALTLLRSGETTLTNKEWKAAVVADPSTALADPASTTDSSGNALVVDGHAVLNGKVTLAVAQGDISMGDYQ